MHATGRVWLVCGRIASIITQFIVTNMRWDFKQNMRFTVNNPKKNKTAFKTMMLLSHYTSCVLLKRVKWTSWPDKGWLGFPSGRTIPKNNAFRMKAFDNFKALEPKTKDCEFATSLVPRTAALLKFNHLLTYAITNFDVVFMSVTHRN